jgi:glutamyl-Q tRNA(Asp) synthetase
MSDYRGRFAPSPTGSLHLGSLFAAVLSYLHARMHQGAWLVRIEDLDPPREAAGAAQQIVDCLAAHGMHSDEPVLFQSGRAVQYEQRLAQLRARQLSFTCACSRRELAAQNGVHTQACRTGLIADPCAIRFRTDHRVYAWTDLVQGPQALTLEQDFVLKRKEGLYAYQLAVVTDDIAQGITHVIRGIDLLASTPMQLALYQAFGMTPPQFGHFPILVDKHGQKLSKQSFAPAVDPSHAARNLLQVLALAGIQIERNLVRPHQILAQAQERWAPPRPGGIVPAPC